MGGPRVYIFTGWNNPTTLTWGATSIFYLTALDLVTDNMFTVYARSQMDGIHPAIPPAGVQIMNLAGATLTVFDAEVEPISMPQTQCPYCNAALIELGGMARCVRCFYCFCTSCEGNVHNLRDE